KDKVNRLRLETVGGSGPYPQKSDKEWDVFSFNSYEEAYHQLMMDLVSIQADSIRPSMNGDDISKIIVTGGFSNNSMFMKLLATKFPDKYVYTADLSDSTALGAALLMKDEKEINPDDFMNLKEVKPLNNKLIRDYHWRNV
ncbi:MAG TPA: FGGY-family carbohydrate kinase, partial [Balneolales bacterium]|nr:FGGY-family carbohydrate kinase [Balneolales bacterium]